MSFNLVQLPNIQNLNRSPSEQNSMYNIAICIPTYKRTFLLKKLILSIANCKIDTSLIKDLNIIVIDNDIERTAEKTVIELKTKLYGILKLHYFNYEKRGLSNIRNELFKIALDYNPDFIAGIDDDEYVSADWLNELLLTITSTNGDIAMGPGISVFDHQVSPYIAYWFKHPHQINHENINSFQTTNFIISARFLLEQKIEFDPRFNSTGAEDTFFGVTAIKNGAKIYWAARAIAYETIQKKRASLNWLIKRRFRTAITYTYILIIEKKYLWLLKKVFVNIIYLITGIIALPLLISKFKFKYWGVLKLAEGFGGFAGLVNIRYHEYK